MRSIASVLRFLFLLVLAAPAAAATFTVGNDASGCTHRRLEAALAAAAANGPASDLIRINSDYAGADTSLSVVNHAVHLVGGHASCLSPTATATTSLSAWSGARVLTVAGSGSRARSVTVENLLITGGAPFDTGSGIAVFGRTVVTVRGSRISGNSGERGGGIYVDGMDMPVSAQLILDASSVDRNYSSQQGAGLYCRGGGHITLRNGTTVHDNGVHSSGALVTEGGGAYLDDCTWYQAGGALNGNRAWRSGAGLFTRGGAQVLIEWGGAEAGATRPRLGDNWAGLAGSGGHGGAIIALDPGTRVDLSGALLEGNLAARGAAILAGDGAHVSMQRDPRCPGRSAGCSELLLNFASEGFPTSIVLISGTATASFQQTMVRENRTDTVAIPGSIFLLDSIGSGPGAQLVLHSSVLTGNVARSLIALDGSHTLFEASEHVDAQFLTTRSNSVASVLDALPRSTSEIRLRASIIDDRAPLHAYPAGPADVFDCLSSAIPPGTPTTRSLVATILLDGDYAPLAGSPALDFCSGPGLTLDRADLHGGARVVNLISVPNRYGSVDVGAIERASEPLPTRTANGARDSF